MHYLCVRRCVDPSLMYHCIRVVVTVVGGVQGTYDHVHMVGYQGARLIPELEEACSAGTLVTSYIPTTYDLYILIL
jgi:hypothetical protein